MQSSQPSCVHDCLSPFPPSPLFLQSVAVLETIRLKKRIPGPFLVVAPITTLGHWQREVESLYNVNCVVYTGSGADRDMIREHEFYHKVGKSNGRRMPKFNVSLFSSLLFSFLLSPDAQRHDEWWGFIHAYID